MKVKELVKQLLECDQELEVAFDRSEDFSNGHNYVTTTGAGEEIVDYYEDDNYNIHNEIKVVTISTN